MEENWSRMFFTILIEHQKFLPYFFRVEVVNDKIKNWDELFFPIDFSHVCEKRDLDKLPQDLFGNKKESDNVERGQSQDNVERGESRQNRSRG